MAGKTYIAIDLKSFYASVECVARGLDPLDTNLIVADPTRTEKTICLAVTPPLKARGVTSRPRLFEVIQQTELINSERRRAAKGQFRGRSYVDSELRRYPDLELDYIIAPPQMAKYMEISGKIYDIYLKYVAPEDVHVYSVDEVFIDATKYLGTYGMTARQFAMTMIKDVLKSTGITATAGIGTNMYLCKIAMDIEAKHTSPDADGMRIAELDEQSYREKLWDHRPLTDFWRIGHGYSEKLASSGIYTMGDIARCSLGSDDEFFNENLLYRLFGVNAELLIDHAWGWEPCEISDVRSYVPGSRSISLGQVLKEPYPHDKGRLIIREMTDLLVLDLVERGLVTDQLVLNVEYDTENLTDPQKRASYRGQICRDRYGRAMPKHAHGTANLPGYTSSSKELIREAAMLYDRITDPSLTVRKLNVVACRVKPRDEIGTEVVWDQIDIFSSPDADDERVRRELAARQRELELQKTIIGVRRKHGKNAVIRGMNLEEGATAVERNAQIGGHRA